MLKRQQLSFLWFWSCERAWAIQSSWGFWSFATSASFAEMSTAIRPVFCAFVSCSWFQNLVVIVKLGRRPFWWGDGSLNTWSRSLSLWMFCSFTQFNARMKVFSTLKELMRRPWPWPCTTCTMCCGVYIALYYCVILYLIQHNPATAIIWQIMMPLLVPSRWPKSSESKRRRRSLQHTV